MVLLAAMPLQFAGFTRDYFGGYRERASFWFGGNIRAALEATLDDPAAAQADAFYISNDIPWVEAYWRFYATVRHERGLIPRARYLRFEEEIPPPGGAALAIVPAQNAAATAALERAGWVARHRVADLDGKPGFVIYGSAGA